MPHRESREPNFTFAVIADTHVTETGATAIGGYDVDTVELGAARSAYVVGVLNHLAPDFVVHLGDATHPEPGTPAYEDSAERFHTIYKALECPLYIVPGNHDIGEKVFVGNPLPRQQAQRTVNDEMIAEYQCHFQTQYYSFEHQDCLFVIINGMIINSGLACEEQQRKWLDALLNANPERRVFIFSHYPPYLSHRDETAHYDAVDEPGRSWLLGLLGRHSVEAFYAGHVHNFFFNRYGETSCYVLPSVCFLRHDYHELFRVAPGMKQGRHDVAKLGFAVVQIHNKGHLNHIIRTYGRTEYPAGEVDPLPLVHGLAPTRGSVGLYLRQPWCDSAYIPTPWGLDAFRRKRVRNDYPLLALWEMGIHDLRVPLDDLADAEAGRRMAELTALGHRFTAYSYGLPKLAARQALIDHGHILDAWEVIAPTDNASELLAEIAAIRSVVPVHFNAYRFNVEAFSSCHGFASDDRCTVEALLALDGARQIIDGVVFGIDWQEAPLPSMIAARNSVAGLGVKVTVHVQFAHRELLNEGETERRNSNRIAEAVVGALAHDDMAVFLDNFIGIDRGYYFSSGLVDRLYNPLAGARIVRNLYAALPEGCEIGAMSENGNDRLIEFRKPYGALLLPAANNGFATLPSAPSRAAGRWIDLTSGESVELRLAGPALLIPK